MRKSLNTFGVAAASVVLIAATAIPSSAADSAQVTTTTTVTGGQLSITSGSPEALGITLTGDASNQVDTAALGTITVTDARGTGAGWHVTAQATHNHDNGTHALPAGTLSLLVPVVTPIDTQSTAPDALTRLSPLIDGGAVTIASAAPDTGMGTFTLASDMTLALPANVYAGSYTSTITVSVVDGPTA